MNSTRIPHRNPPDVSIAPRLVAVSSIFFTLALLLFATRIYVRYRSHGLGKDDFALSAGMASGTALFAVQIISVAHGTGRHVFYVSWQSLQLQYLLNIIIGQFYVWSVTMVKMSLSFMLLRIQNSRAWRIGLYALILPQLGVAIASVLLDGLRCHPIRAASDFSIPRDRCMPLLNYQTSIYVSSGVFVLTDIIYSCIPIIIISRIHRPLRERIVICLLMALGFLATAATIPKIISVKYYGFKGDATFHTSDVLLWSLLEVNLGIIAACVPTLRGPFETALKQWGLISATQLGTKPTSPGYQRQGHEQRMPPRRPSDSQFSMPWDKKVPVEKASWLEISTDDLSKMRQR